MVLGGCRSFLLLVTTPTSHVPRPHPTFSDSHFSSLNVAFCRELRLPDLTGMALIGSFSVMKIKKSLFVCVCVCVHI